MNKIKNQKSKIERKDARPCVSTITIIAITIMANICFAESNLVAHWSMNDREDSNVVAATVGSNAVYYGTKPNYIGTHIYGYNCNVYTAWTKYPSDMKIANDTTHTEYGGASVKATCSAAATWGKITHTMTKTDLTGTHFAVRMYIYKGVSGEPNSYLNLNSISMNIEDANGDGRGFTLWSNTTGTYGYSGYSGWYWFTGDINEPTSSYAGNFKGITKIYFNFVDDDEVTCTASVSVDKIVFYKPTNPKAMVLFELDGGLTRQKPALNFLQSKGMRGTVFANSFTAGTAGHLNITDYKNLDANGHTIGIYATDGNMWYAMTNANKEAMFIREQNWLINNNLKKGIRVAAQSGVAGVNDVDMTLLPIYCDMLLGGICPAAAYRNNALWNLQLPVLSYFEEVQDVLTPLTKDINNKMLMVYIAHLYDDANALRFRNDVNTIAAKIADGNLVCITPNQLLIGTTSDNNSVGKIGGALKFNGINDYVMADKTGATLRPFFQHSFSVGMWVEPNDSQAANWSGLFGNNDSQAKLNLVIEPNGEIDFFYQSDQDAGGVSARSGNVKFSNGQNSWHHIVGTIEEIDPCTARARLYFDGVLVGTNQNVPYVDEGELFDYVTMSHFSVAVPIAIGNGLNDGDFDPYTVYKGLIDDVRIYNKALSPVQIRQLYIQGKAGKSLSTIPVRMTKGKIL